ncbi:HAUS augmin-like complex subunit 3 [Alosa sapidissima]|uniref:HAUS augmin-like complex subunit 3 n=1 Tax=Alosa sapidissima TaxID=34773 RepID=UPI001C0A46C6|nr:HAUS augmin-like complex subunit 3 [Alosa sapidissima]XP_041926181.1 HAUS augmin-like complex subunit 3 [Alosa sapidissima]
MSGVHFVETLFRLGYPEASTLKPTEFDWMFDDTAETQEFLRFFCGLGAQNVLSEEEKRGYTSLVELGKPILTELELEKLEQLMRSRQLELNEEDESDELVDVVEDTADESLVELQQELENLHKQKRLKHQRLLQLQGLGQRYADGASALSESAQSQEQDDGGAEPVAVAKALAKENVTTNVVLQDLQGEVKKLQGLVFAESDDVEKQQEYLQMECHSRRSAALLSLLPLQPYLQEVQLALHNIMGHYKRCLAEETSMLDEEGDDGKEEGDVVERNKGELARLQAAFLLVQAQLVQARAEEAGARASKEWLSQKRSSDAQSVPPDPDATPTVPADRLLALLHHCAKALCLPVLLADARDQAETVKHVATLQEHLWGALLSQLTQLELLRALLGAERDAHVAALTRTERLARTLEEEEAAWASRRSVELRRLQESVPGPQSEPILSTKDPTVKRLLAMLESPEETDRCFDCLVDLTDLISAQSAEVQQLGGSKGLAVAELQSLQVGLEEEHEALRRTALSEAGQVQLSPQDMSETMQELEKQTASFFKQLQQVTAELSSKRSLLKRSAPLRWERELYVLFHLDPSQLSRVLEDWEDHE